MKNYKHLIVTALSCAVIVGFASSAWAADAAASRLGHVLIDVSRHGEAWYVNPHTHMRIYLGRPNEALERLRGAGVHVDSLNIARLPEAAGGAGDAAYAEAVSGEVLMASDIPGAAWYVDPVLHFRRRLASAWDAWEIMRYGEPVSAATLAAIPVEPTVSVTEMVTCREVMSADTLALTDGRTVRLLNVDIPSNPELQSVAMDELRPYCDGREMVIERDMDARDADGKLLRHAFAGDVYLNGDLVRGGLAFHDIQSPNFKYAEEIVVAGLDAQHQKKGFWNK
jgi:endonuclease YncB( thermonuclease family)